jgi:hypothetical protein
MNCAMSGGIDAVDCIAHASFGSRLSLSLSSPLLPLHSARSRMEVDPPPLPAAVPSPSSAEGSAASAAASAAVAPSTASAVVPPARRPALKGEDAWKRMNFLLHSAHAVAAAVAARPKLRTMGLNLSRFYLQDMRRVASKLVLRMSDTDAIAQPTGLQSRTAAHCSLCCVICSRLCYCAQ